MKRFPLILCCVLALLCWGQHRATAQTNVIITLSGDNFTPQSSVFIGTTQFTPEYVSPSTLRVSIPRAMLSSAQPNNVRVVNPSAGGGSSRALPLVVACTTTPLSPRDVIADCSMIFRTTTYDQIDSIRLLVSGRTITENESSTFKYNQRPFSTRQAITTKLFADGNFEMRVNNLSPNTPSIISYTPSVPQLSIKFVILTTIDSTARFFNQDSVLLFIAPMGAGNFKPFTDKIIGLLRPSTTNNDSSVVTPMQLGEYLLYEAQQMGLTITPLGMNRYKIIADNAHKFTPHLPPTPDDNRSRYTFILNTNTNSFERIDCEEDGVLKNRTYYQYTIQNFKPVIQRVVRILFDSVNYDGDLLLPIQQISIDTYENMTINQYLTGQ